MKMNIKGVGRCGGIVAISGIIAILNSQAEVTGVSQKKGPQKSQVMVSSGQISLSVTEKSRLKLLTGQHQKIRSKLQAGQRDELDILTAELKKRLFSRPLTGRLLTTTVQIVDEMIPGLSTQESRSLAEYLLGGIAKSDQAIEAASRSMQEMQMSFNLQYLQLQSQMQDENRSYTMISNIMKNKHDTVKNSINNIR
ncbi:MAG: hypothetical protein HGB00_01430 [Chlorobiaceae bacterium]|nr:hypothetical protein [Chlorobiaceae bacterium]